MDHLAKAGSGSIALPACGSARGANETDPSEGDPSEGDPSEGDPSEGDPSDADDLTAEQTRIAVESGECLGLADGAEWSCRSRDVELYQRSEAEFTLD